jgi:NCS1 family nucleobase:cation symporter-1
MGKASNFLRKLEAPHPEGLSGRQLFLTNEDLLPVREEHKTWNHWNFVSSLLRLRAWPDPQVSFWIADSFNLNTFVIASSMISAGLTWWQVSRL